METQVLQVDPQRPDPQSIQSAADVLKQGGLVAFPTETVYGLGANAMDGDALSRIFVAKQRPTSDPIIAHIASVAQLTDLAVDVPDVAWDLADAFWPGPLTLILKRSPTVPDLIAEGRDTIAIRIPAHPITRAILTAAGLPIGAPSANRFTRPSATQASHVLEDLGGRIDMIIDGGNASIGLESTVLDLTSDPPRILRPGGLVIDRIRVVLPGVEFAPAYVQETEGHQSPGQMLKHYSPRATVLLFRGERRESTLERMALKAAELRDEDREVGALVTDEDAHALGEVAQIEQLGGEADAEEQARQLFAALRRLDERGVDTILVREPDRVGLGQALSDRLVRAAVGRVIEC